VVLSVGVNERTPVTVGQVWNANLVSKAPARWSTPPQSSLRPGTSGYLVTRRRARPRPGAVDGWQLGALICGENNQPRWPGSPCWPRASGARGQLPAELAVRRPDRRRRYDLAENIRSGPPRTASREVFTVVAAPALDDAAVAEVRRDARIEKI